MECSEKMGDGQIWGYTWMNAAGRILAVIPSLIIKQTINNILPSDNKGAVQMAEPKYTCRESRVSFCFEIPLNKAKEL